MSDMRTRCLCTLSDCAYYNEVEGMADKCDCAHPDKEYYMTNPCPLYKKEWADKHKSAQHFRDMLRKKRQL